MALLSTTNPILIQHRRRVVEREIHMRMRYPACIAESKPQPIQLINRSFGERKEGEGYLVARNACHQLTEIDPTTKGIHPVHPPLNQERSLSRT